MGVMIDGTYHVNDPAPDSYEGGEFKRAAYRARLHMHPQRPRASSR